VNRKATERLRLDRRLLNRRGWITKAEREKELAALPDVSHKIAPPDEESSEDGSATSSPEGGAIAAPDSPRAE
jgi:hypothetical protein